ncbi:hypothetical protein EsDP_00005949 [Epichloe bromicola]|uniref:mRNA splicing factor RNA helicase n=1 Tax=Epichloe bromicola TaxID=79588 RepID=A0ABQ0CWM3_9HYPO
MDPAPREQDPSAPAIKFRNTTKNRKALRQRAQDDQHQQGHQQPDPPSSPTHDTESSSVTAALRARNARKYRLRGVGFSTDSHADDHAAQLPADDDSSKHLAVAKGIPDRFMHQTGLVSNLNDKHMTDYIESRLSSRAAPAPSYSQPEHASTFAPSSDQRPLAVQPTRHGRLVEVDLSSHLARYDDRKPKAAGPPRRRNRRGSDDVKRDQLVEAFLHENKLDVYDVPTQNSGKPAGDNRSADDRMAEEFRRRYLDEMAARRQRRKPIPQTKQQKQEREQQAREVLKGPKLGGSRNQRAAVRNILLKQEKEKLGRRV